MMSDASDFFTDLSKKLKANGGVPVDTAMEASGKKVGGGLHKFDASEVDIDGGDATADDLMDAFGFGGDSDAEDAPAAAADAPGGDVVYADEVQKHLTSILHGVLAASPADPFKEMYKGCFAAS